MSGIVISLYDIGIVVFGLVVGTIFGVSAHEAYKMFKYGGRK